MSQGTTTIPDFPPNQKKPRNDQRVAITLVIVIIFAMAIGGMFTVLVLGLSCNCDKNSTSINTWQMYSPPSSLILVNRSEWHANPVKGTEEKLLLPAYRVVVAHTLEEPCTSRISCGESVRYLQEFHQDTLNFTDIAFNFLVGGDGRVYEGRGWDIQGNHTEGWNSDTIGIGLVGNFSQESPPEQQFVATKLILREGVRQRKLIPEYELYVSPHSDPADNPDRLFAEMRTWPNWSGE